jgi:hypothetical protein
MKFIVQLLVIAILAYVFELFLPWWSIAVAAFIGGLAFNTRVDFFAGFFGIGMLWLIVILLIESTAAAPLTERVATIFSVSKPVLIIITVSLGGLVGGFAAMTGAALRKDKRRRLYY